MPQSAVTSPLPATNMEEEECGVCYQGYGADRKACPLTACRHVVCDGCLKRLATEGAVKCPFCRAHSPLPSDEEEVEDAEGVARKSTGPRSWLKRLCRKARAGSRRQDSLGKDDIRDLALMSSYFF
ncbi:RING finger protein 227-like [Pelobates fuscus]|uniref:RING finger protein 227-like n=1 Tax=Pelobates fuscus TaxID=191477 RepID=UPI002FE430F6